MEICDLRNPRQKWFFKETEDSFSKLMSSYQGNEVRVFKNYGYLSNENSEENGIIKILNHNKIKENVSKPLYQFNIEIFAISNIDNTKLFIYPSSNGYNYLSQVVNLNGYKNYYNLHNHSFFSNYGIADGSQVCYISKQIKIGSSSSDWVENDYCSNQDKMPKASQWFFKDNNPQSNLGKSYNIIDIGKNKLRTSKKLLSKSYKALYTGNLYWYDNSENILETFYLPAEVQNLLNLNDPNLSLGSQFQINVDLKINKNEFK